ncbi:MAG: FAD:protein FMN transferase [Sideroxyarcus sp.]|nr:FAD:protein FMN transferase [Sideroxyarcus sp.]
MFELSRENISCSREQNRALKSGSNSGWVKREETIMGTAISVELWSDDQVIGAAAIDAVIDEMHRIDRMMSPHKADSELSLINHAAGSGPITVSSEMFHLLARAAHFSQLSGGAFDITYAAVGRLFDYRLHTRPNQAELDKARLAVGYGNVLLDAKNMTVQFSRPDVCIDLGGFAKGHAVDNATKILHEFEIAHANVSAGGDSRVIGDRRGRPWMIGVRDPRSENGVIAVLPLEDTSISTSGDYERYFIQDGKRFHHLIDPATGQSPDSVRSVTILAEDGLTTEAFSKIVFVMGLTRGMQVIESQQGIDAVVVDAGGVLHYSTGMLAPQA